MSWTASAPSNLALIKYAGKKDKSNIPLNASLSYTLDHLITKVRITKTEGPADTWKALEDKDILKIPLSRQGINRFLNFFGFLKKVFHVPGFYLVESGNNFSADVGLASSASSFCALTQASYKMALDFSVMPEEVRKYSPVCLSKVSREGSGSSCRSFFRPWALWEGEGACKMDLPFSKLTHQLIMTDHKKKPVSSSLAHEKIVQSPLFKGRVQRAETRLKDLLPALKEQDWKACFKISWEEFQDLHQCYESVGIMYQNDKSREVLKKLKVFWKKQGDGPIVTMDAGSAVHLLYRPDQKKLANHISLLLQPLNIYPGQKAKASRLV